MKVWSITSGPRRVGRTRAVRYAAGKALRKRVPRSTHAVWAPPHDRPDPIDLVAELDKRRIAELIPILYGRMSLSPFTFLRGSAAVMARDLSATPTTRVRVQLCGDAHVSNFGVYEPPGRGPVFGLTDFDETLPGPWEWDLKRLATSLVVAGRANHFPPAENRRAARASITAYREWMHRFAEMTYLDLWYCRIDPETAVAKLRLDGVSRVKPSLVKGRRRTSLEMFPRLAEVVRGQYRIRDEPPLIVHYSVHEGAEESRRFYDRYLGSLSPPRRALLERYRVVDIARKVVGVGSVGTRCSIMLLMGDPDVEDPLFLQIKQALPSVLERYAGPSVFTNHAERVVNGQRLTQQVPDLVLGWSRLGGSDFYVRQLHTGKTPPDVPERNAKELIAKAELCGVTLARAHARTGDPAMIAGYLGNGPGFDDAVADFAEAYADQTEADHALLVAAIKRGKIAAKVDV